MRLPWIIQMGPMYHVGQYKREAEGENQEGDVTWEGVAMRCALKREEGGHEPRYTAASRGGQVKKIDSLLEPSDRVPLCRHLDFSPLRSVWDS